jgi:putative tryptophan/tyrosine transport system substrate-binding protein
MRRREFICLVSGAVLWPLASHAQQRTMPAIGFLGGNSPSVYKTRLQAFHAGLKEAGYTENENVTIEYRWAEDQNNRLSGLAAELVRRQVAVLVAAGGTPSAMAAKAATATIPIVFAVATNPIELGLVASLNRPGGNLTGVANLNLEMGPKRLEVLRELLPGVTVIAILVNPTNGAGEAFIRVLRPAAQALGVQLRILDASTDRDLEKAFTALGHMPGAPLVIGPDNFFNSRSKQIAELSARYGVPTAYQYRPFAVAGGLLSYGSDETEYYRLVGIYTGKILDGAKPADLPVVQSTKAELIINLKTAKALGISVPQSLLGRADEVIE